MADFLDRVMVEFIDVEAGVHCVHDGCMRLAEARRLVGMLAGAPDVDGLPHPDGVTCIWDLVCLQHAGEVG